MQDVFLHGRLNVNVLHGPLRKAAVDNAACIIASSQALEGLGVGSGACKFIKLKASKALGSPLGLCKIITYDDV